MSHDISIPTHASDYNRRARGNDREDDNVRVYRGMYKRVTLQIRNDKHFMTASLDATMTKRLIEALQINLAELVQWHPEEAETQRSQNKIRRLSKEDAEAERDAEYEQRKRDALEGFVDD